MSCNKVGAESQSCVDAQLELSAQAKLKLSWGPRRIAKLELDMGLS